MHRSIRLDLPLVFALAVFLSALGIGGPQSGSPVAGDAYAAAAGWPAQPTLKAAHTWHKPGCKKARSGTVSVCGSAVALPAHQSVSRPDAVVVRRPVAPADVPQPHHPARPLDPPRSA